MCGLCVSVLNICTQADSGYDEELYGQLAAAPLLLLDGRAVGSAEHAGFAELQAAGGWVIVEVGG